MSYYLDLAQIGLPYFVASTSIDRLISKSVNVSVKKELLVDYGL